MTRKLTESVLRDAVMASKTMSELARKCGMNGTGGSYDTLRKLALFYQIDISAFDPKQQMIKSSTHLPKVERLNKVKHDIDSLRENFFISTDIIRKILKKVGVKNVCAECNVSDTYNNKPLILQIDHINGNKYDNRIENLRYLCANCHSQTKSFASRNRFDYSSLDLSEMQKTDHLNRIEWPDVQCKSCSKNIPGHKNNPKYCSYKCANLGYQKTALTAEEILDIFNKNNGNFLKTGREIGISDNAVRKRLRKAGLLT